MTSTDHRLSLFGETGALGAPGGTRGDAVLLKIDVLAARLGVTKGSFYWHFESLPAYLEALAEHWCGLRDAAVEAFPSSSPPEPAARLMYLMEEISDRATWNLERAIRAWAGRCCLRPIRLARSVPGSPCPRTSIRSGS